MNPRHDEQIEEIRNNLLTYRKILTTYAKRTSKKIFGFTGQLHKRRYFSVFNEDNTVEQI